LDDGVQHLAAITSQSPFARIAFLVMGGSLFDAGDRWMSGLGCSGSGIGHPVGNAFVSRRVEDVARCSAQQFQFSNFERTLVDFSAEFLNQPVEIQIGADHPLRLNL